MFVENRMHFPGVRAIVETEGLKNYHVYRMKPWDMLGTALLAALLSGAIAWLFYRSLHGLVTFPFLWLLTYHKQKEKGRKKQQQELREAFKECIRVVTGSLQSGYSVENAFLEAEKELLHVLGKQADMCMELREINQKIKLNLPVEGLLQNLADRSGVEEILSFSQVFGYAKRNGSDFMRILKDTSERIVEKNQVEREIQTTVAAKKMEQKIMNVIPLGILCFVNLTSPEFLQVMYTGVLGRGIMSIFLVVYAGAYLMSEKIVDINV